MANHLSLSNSLIREQPFVADNLCQIADVWFLE